MGNIENKKAPKCAYKDSHYCVYRSATDSHEYYGPLKELQNKECIVHIRKCLIPIALEMGYMIHWDNDSPTAIYPSGAISRLDSIEKELKDLKDCVKELSKLIKDEQERRVVIDDMKSLEKELNKNSATNLSNVNDR